MNSAGQVRIQPDSWTDTGKRAKGRIYFFPGQSGQFLAGFLAGFDPVLSRQIFFFRRLKSESVQNPSKHQPSIYTLKFNIYKPK